MNEPFIWLRQDFDGDGDWIEVHPNKGMPLYAKPQIKPLSTEDIEKIFFKLVDRDPYEHRNEKFYTEFARAIEERHGIK